MACEHKHYSLNVKTYLKVCLDCGADISSNDDPLERYEVSGYIYGGKQYDVAHRLIEDRSGEDEE